MVCYGLFAGACSSPSSPSSAPTLTVARDGTGSGTVTSSPAGISCGTTCQQSYSSGTTVTLAAAADAGSVFAGWTGGGCSGTGSCQVVVTASTTATATFNRVTSGPFTVKQTETLGGETLSGMVCDITKPFAVFAVAPAASWSFLFLPTTAEGGAVSYAYSIPSAGESHNAAGTYTIGQPATDGTRVLTMAVRDHVVFKGFDGVIPVSYHFSLVPAVSCQ
jgi:hypothetical protein